MTAPSMTADELTAVVRLKITTPSRAAAVAAALATVPTLTEATADRVAVLMGGERCAR